MNENGMEKAGSATGNDEKPYEILVSKSVVMRPLVRTRRGLVEIKMDFKEVRLIYRHINPAWMCQWVGELSNGRQMWFTVTPT
jgi:hypothetical protein